MSEASLPPQARNILKTVFGYEDFRPGQTDVIAAILKGGPVLAIMPTGSGKSMCYQLPALLDGGLTLVVSPLIALMRDQVQQMRAVGVSAASLNSNNTADESAEAWRLIRSNDLRLLFVSPERLALDGLTTALRRCGIRRVAVDEAHCVSEWGHDFRPEYRQIRSALDALGQPQAIAFTATADRATRADIIERLFPSRPDVFLQSFDRPNLDLRFEAKDQPRRQLTQFIARHRGQSGIIYCASRKKTQSLADYLAAQGHETVAYHAGMDLDARNRSQDRFLSEDGVIAVATVAFGMGVNKPDVRFVAHADMPASVESYYQEIGRAGRDGLPAQTLTLYGVEDMALRRRQIDEKSIDAARRTLERGKLAALTALCEAAQCRRQLLLAYFDEHSSPCGRCDVCTGQVALYDGTIDAQKALSAVARTGQRFGAGYLVSLLVGEATDAMRRNTHETLKTFGIGKDRSKSAWGAIYRQLFACEALETTHEDHGGFQLTEKGKDILLGRRAISLRAFTAPARRAGRSTGRDWNSDHVDGELLAKLKALRRELARDEGVPAFMVFPDKTLIDMAERRPATLAEMGAVHGIGQRKLMHYGEAFLAAIQDA